MQSSRFDGLVRWCTGNRGWYSLSYLLDWLVCGAILILNISFTQYWWEPTTRYLPLNYQSLTYPSQDEILPTWLVVLLTIILPVAIFLVFQIALRSAHDFHHACLGLFETLVFNLVFTTAMQYLGGKYTPDWYDRTRAGTSNVLKEGKLSYPSWHASTTFAGLGYFSLYLAGKLGVFRRNSGHTWKAVIVLIPLLGACLVALTRTLDYHNDFDDITAGALIGLLMCKFCYTLNFNSLFSTRSHLPLIRNGTRYAIAARGDRDRESDRRMSEDNEDGDY